MKIKKGQKWRWVGGDWSSLYTPEKVYEVQDTYANDDGDVKTIMMEDDQAGRHTWPNNFSFFDNFELVIGEPDVKARIADEAKRIVTGARRSAYGSPEQNFERIARFWQAYFENTGRGDLKITAADVSPMMRLMKEARLAETPDHYDSFVDLVGYTLTGAEVNGVKPLDKPVG